MQFGVKQGQLFQKTIRNPVDYGMGGEPLAGLLFVFAIALCQPGRRCFER